MSDIQQQRAHIREQMQQAQQAENTRLAQETAYQRQIAEGKRALSELDRQEQQRALDAAVRESENLHAECLSSARELIEAVEAHNLDGMLDAGRRVHNLHQRIFHHNKAALIPSGGLTENFLFQRFSWGLAVNLLIGVPLAGVQGEELRIRQGMAYALGGQILQSGDNYTLEKAIEQTRAAAHQVIVRGGW